MGRVKYGIILFFINNIIVTDVVASFEPFVYEENPSVISEKNQNHFQATNYSDAFDAQKESELSTDFIGHKKEGEFVEKLDTGFEGEKMVEIGAVSKDFESTGPEVEDRILTDIQKNSQKILEERLREDSKKQQKLIAFQEQEYLKMRQKVWKTFEAKADGIIQKRELPRSQEQKAVQVQSLLQQLQAAKNALVEKDKLANDLADKLAKVNAQRVIAAQRLQVQKITRRSLAGAVDSKTKQESAQLMQARNQEQINTDTFVRLDKQFNNLNIQLQDARNQAQSVRAQFREIQQAIEQQLPQTSGKEEAY